MRRAARVVSQDDELYKQILYSRIIKTIRLFVYNNIDKIELRVESSIYFVSLASSKDSVIFGIFLL